MGISDAELTRICGPGWERVDELVSERDENVLIRKSGEFRIVKIFNTERSSEDIKLVTSVLKTVAADIFCPRVLFSDNRICLLDFIEGRVVSSLNKIPKNLFTEVGAAVAALTCSLGKISDCHKRQIRLEWHFYNYDRVLDKYVCDVEYPDIIREVDERWIKPNRSILEKLPMQMCHNDCNLDNLLVTADGRVAIIDFGDLDIGFRVSDISICLCYLIGTLFKNDRNPSVDEVRELVKATMEDFNILLSENEVKAIPVLVLMRAVMSLCIQSHNRKVSPDNSTYLSVSMKSNWGLLLFALRNPEFIHIF